VRSVKSLFLKFFILTGMLLGLPMLGVILAGYPMTRYLEFPPETRYVFHAPFSWIAFIAYTLFILAVVLPLIVSSMVRIPQFKIRPSAIRSHLKNRILAQGQGRTEFQTKSILKYVEDLKRGPNTEIEEKDFFEIASNTFPWWGWMGLLTGAVSWILAWTRFPWFARYQPHTFTPLWLSFILVINALCHKRTGHCMMIDRTRFFLMLFPLSAAFWWFFEYLNRFVQNWSYTGVHYSSWEYFCYATLSFSTVLPAVLGTREWMAGASRTRQGMWDFHPLRFPYPRMLAGAALLVSGVSLAGIGIWPNYLFPLLWVSPLIVIVSLQTLTGKCTILSGITNGDWSLIITSAAAALLCGGFWEMWNYYSLARWEYSVPFVHGFQIFEMPLLGYAGYLPFGLECMVVGDLLERWMRSRSTI